MAINIIDVNLPHQDNYSVRSGAPTGFVAHHAAASSASVETVNNWHINGNGWAMIGYHFYIRKDGTIYRGRPENWMGAHTSGHNEKIGFCAEGNFENEQMPAAQKAAIVELLKYLYGKYGQLPVYRHRDLDATACPGANYPFDEIVALSKKTTSTTTTKPVETKPTTVKPNAKDPRFNNIVYEFQKACIKDGLGNLLPSGADGIWGAECEKAAEQYLEVGSEGERVRLAQLLITGWNIKLEGNNNGVDGIFGQSTKDGVIELQALKDISEDGVIGPQVWKILCGLM